MPSVLASLQDHIRRPLPRSFVLTIVALLLLGGAGFGLRRAMFGAANPALDERLSYTPREALDFLLAIERHGRDIYVQTLLSLDMVFPVLFAILLAIPLARLFPRSDGRVLWLPIGIVLVDWAENCVLALIASAPAAATDARIVTASTLTTCKWGLIAMAVIAILVGFRRRARGRTQPASGAA